MANEVVKKEPKKENAIVAKLNGEWKKAIEDALPSKSECGRFIAMAMSQLTDPKVGPRLQQCSTSSFYNCIIKAARTGIMPDGVNAYLIPYGTECQLQFSYKGLCDMAIREGIAVRFIGDTVRKNDIFKWSNGELVEHTPIAWDEEERGDIVGVWTRAFLPDGSHKDKRLSVKEIDEIRKKSQNSGGVWKEWYEEMAIKSCLKRMFKTMRNTPRLQAAIDADNENYNLGSPIGRREARNQIDGLIDDNDGDDKAHEKITNSKSPLDDEK